MGFVTLVGRPNVGKSTLLNALLGEKLSITSPRPQTTRHQIMGIRTGEGYQVAIWDTPGFMRRAKDPLDRRMRLRIREALAAADLAVLVAPPAPPGEAEAALIGELQGAGIPAVLAINKIDRVQKQALLPVIRQYADRLPFREIVPVSALEQDGTDLLLERIVLHLPRGEPQYGAEELTDRPERFLVAELVREQLFRLYGQEVPYDTAVEVEGFQEADGVTRTKDLIQVAIYVNKRAQRRILVGAGGRALKEVGSASRREMERLLGRGVFLELWVQVRPDWRESQSILDELGY